MSWHVPRSTLGTHRPLCPVQSALPSHAAPPCQPALESRRVPRTRRGASAGATGASAARRARGRSRGEGHGCGHGGLGVAILVCTSRKAPSAPYCRGASEGRLGAFQCETWGHSGRPVGRRWDRITSAQRSLVQWTRRGLLRSCPAAGGTSLLMGRGTCWQRRHSEHRPAAAA